jgi:hypothetical protein
MAVERRDLGEIGGLENAHRLVVERRRRIPAPGGEQLAVGTERHRQYPSRLPAEHAPRLLVGDVPQSYGPVDTTGRQ